VLEVQDLLRYERELTQEFEQLQQAQLTLQSQCQSLKVKQELNTKQLKELQQEEQQLQHQQSVLYENNPLFVAKTYEQLASHQALVKQKLNALKLQVGSVTKELEINTHNIQKYEKHNKQLQKKQERYQLYTKLNDMIGSAKGDKFKTFAQGITFEQLITLANEHLKVLSPRYVLTRNNEEILALDVVDTYQGGVVRSALTLSGGESFIVSLALALGLSELASQKISIDSLFLDEGFGTLDEESLEMALNALNLLQSSGKMVGVISHVEALKERIPTQIKVVPQGDGVSSVSLQSERF
jgi:exonuclease SbcC